MHNPHARRVFDRYMERCGQPLRWHDLSLNSPVRAYWLTVTRERPNEGADRR